MKYILTTIALLLLMCGSAFGATYYVNPDAAGAEDGTSHADAWTTIAQVNANAFSTSDDVYFFVGKTWTGEQLVVDWSGTSGDPVIIGAYDNDGNLTDEPTGTMPIIDGDGNTVPTQDGYTGLVHIEDQEYVEVRDLNIKDSGGIGVRVQSSPNVTVHDCEIHGSYRFGISFLPSSGSQQGSDDGVVEYCEVYQNSYRAAVEVSGTDPPQIAVKRSDNFVIQYSTIRDGYFEGIDIDVGSTNAIVKYNAIYGNPRLQVYIVSCTGAKVFGNLIYGTNTNANSEDGRGQGVWMSHEAQWVNEMGSPLAMNAEVYNNLIANCLINVWFAGASDRQITGCKVYNNTLVEAYYEQYYRDVTVQSGSGSGHEFKNNIIKSDNAADEICHSYSGIVDMD
ncbi:MAG: hypothetical protein GF334_13865, partial [Candidatus Altiarchaeales archaeon]|nr:hypothetical protein [Candidatus Altiarchaeales archaeon]